MNLIKGRGGALLREKIVARASQRFVIVVDEQKIVGRLGAHGEVPVEVVPFGWQNTARNLQSLGWNPGLRVGSDGEPYRTDGGHYILDCSFVLKSATLESRCAELDRTVGVVEHGLFLNMATEVHVADAAGVRILLPG